MVILKLVRPDGGFGPTLEYFKFDTGNTDNDYNYAEAFAETWNDIEGCIGDVKYRILKKTKFDVDDTFHSVKDIREYMDGQFSGNLEAVMNIFWSNFD